ncbi:MAG: 2-oxoacid:acceptor oxidoreductase family protein [Oscillospiraceae bacterium]|nr:2-oxoacid:acceptor oxidoreductase family protein [Oscillospiraceae bacterium]
MSNNSNFKLHEILIAGFGGQGVLFAGKLLANIAMIDEREVTWMPSYGPAMRGGVCNCAVCISGTLIGSPVVHHPDTLICMNGPSFDKFVPNVRKGGTAYIDSSIIESTYDTNDFNCQYIPATTLATDNGLKPGLGIIVILGKVIKDTGITDLETVKKAIAETTHKTDMIDANVKAIEIGMSL